MRIPRLIPVARFLLLLLFAVGVTLAAIFGTLSSNLTATPYLVYAAIGLLITSRQPHNPIGWLFLATGAIAGLNGALYAITEAAAGAPYADDWFVLLAAWAYNFVWLTLLSVSTVFTLLLFPNGLMSTRWRPVLWVAAAATALGVGVAALAPDLMVGNDSYPNPLHPGPWGSTAGFVFGAAIVALLVCGVLSVIQVVLRYRRARGVERLQLQWFAFSAVVFASLLVISSQVDGPLRHPLLGDLLFTVGASMIPLSCGLAILRYRLYDLGRIVSRTTSYAIVTGLVIATYGVVVTAVTRVVPNSDSLAVAGATLAAAAVARPLLHKVQGAVDRRFNRTRYDAQHTVDRFGEALRHEVDASALEAHLVEAVDQTLQPSQLRLWLKEVTP
jgi:hypothetical protein